MAVQSLAHLFVRNTCKPQQEAFVAQRTGRHDDVRARAQSLGLHGFVDLLPMSRHFGTQEQCHRENIKPAHALSDVPGPRVEAKRFKKYGLVSAPNFDAISKTFKQPTLARSLASALERIDERERSAIFKPDVLPLIEPRSLEADRRIGHAHEQRPFVHLSIDGLASLELGAVNLVRGLTQEHGLGASPDPKPDIERVPAYQAAAITARVDPSGFAVVARGQQS